MKQTVISGLFFVLAGMSLSTCQRSPQGPVVARVGTTPITLEDLKARLAETPAAYRQYAASPDGRRQFLNLLIREKILLVEAKKLGIPQDPAYQQAVAKFKAEWKRRLQDYQDTLQVESALRRLRTKDLAATDTEVDKYYEEHRADYEHPIEITTSHILLSSEADAQRALDRLKDGEPFERVAKDMSKDPATAVRGGKLAPFRRGTLVPEFEDTAFKLKVGEISGIVKSQFGFHIIRKLGEKQVPARAAAEVKDEIRAKLERDKFDHWVDAKQAIMGVTVDDQAMSRLPLEEPAKP
jgi:parvulin-like peptidyl-prolyl isomerase